MNKVAVIGSLNMDILVEVNEFPKPGQTVMANSIDYKAGGKGVNQAAAAAALEASTILIGNVGEDAFGQQIIAKINQIPNLDSSRVINSTKENTGIASILTKDAENCIAVVPGANKLTNGKIAEENEFIFKEADSVVTQFEIPDDGIKETLKAAKFGNSISIFNPAPYRKIPEEWLSAITIITPNESEFTDMAEDFNIAPGTIEKRILDWQKKYPDTKLIVTRGKDGLSYVEGENVVTLEPIKAKLVDSTGAGDIFTGALAALLSRDIPIEEAIYKASVAAGLSVEHKGALGSEPKMEDINLYLSKTQEGADNNNF